MCILREFTYKMSLALQGHENDVVITKLYIIFTHFAGQKRDGMTLTTTTSYPKKKILKNDKMILMMHGDSPKIMRKQASLYQNGKLSTLTGQ